MGLEWFKSLDNTPNGREGGAPDQEKPLFRGSNHRPQSPISATC